MINDAIVVTGGPYRGWVGYIQEEEIDGYIQIKLFASDGTISDLELDIDYVKNVEPRTTIEILSPELVWQCCITEEKF